MQLKLLLREYQALHQALDLYFYINIQAAKIYKSIY